MNPPENQKDPLSPLAQRFRGFLPVVIDVESGGFNSQTDALLEIAAVTIRMDDNGLIHRHETFSFISTRLKARTLNRPRWILPALI